MKIGGAALIMALGVASTSAFVPQSVPFKRTSPTFSYLGNLNGDGGSNGLSGTQTKVRSETNRGTASRGSSANQRMKEIDQRITGLERERAENGPKKSWETSAPIIVQGGSLRTWSFASPFTDAVQVVLRTDGRPLDADVELWHGPDNTPHRMKIYVEDGSLRPFRSVMETPRGPNTIAIRNTGQLEFPMTANVGPDIEKGTNGLVASTKSSYGETIQGGALKTYPFDPTVESVKLLLRTDGRPLNARIELLQGPNNNKQVIELYTEDGMDRPFFAVVETPGSGNVVKVTNTAPVEFPLSAVVEPYEFGTGDALYEDGIVLGRQW